MKPSIKLVPMVPNHFGNTHYIEVTIGSFTLHREFQSEQEAQEAIPDVTREALRISNAEPAAREAAFS